MCVVKDEVTSNTPSRIQRLVVVAAMGQRQVPQPCLRSENLKDIRRVQVQFLGALEHRGGIQNARPFDPTTLPGVSELDFKIIQILLDAGTKDDDLRVSHQVKEESQEILNVQDGHVRIL